MGSNRSKKDIVVSRIVITRMDCDNGLSICTHRNHAQKLLRVYEWLQTKPPFIIPPLFHMTGVLTCSLFKPPSIWLSYHATRELASDKAALHE